MSPSAERGKRRLVRSLEWVEPLSEPSYVDASQMFRASGMLFVAGYRNMLVGGLGIYFQALQNQCS